MTSKKSTKKALISSLLSLVLCVTMFIGSTFAWFTDSATTGVNKITAGNLDMELKYSYNLSDWKDAENSTEIFDSNALWEPGYTQVVYFKVSNKGNLAFNYRVGTNIVNNVLGMNKDGQSIDLTEYIKFGIVELSEGTEAFSKDAAGRKAAQEAITPVDFTDFYLEEKSLLKGEHTIFAMVVYMPETVDNKANHDGNNVPSIEFGVQVAATQKMEEEDSFGSDYDSAATYPSVGFATYTEGTAITISGSGFEATIPAEAVLQTEDGVTLTSGTELVMSVEEAENVASNITVGVGAVAETYEVTLQTKDGERVEATNGEITVEMQIGAGRTGSITLYHYDQEVTGVQYDSATGTLTFATDSFSPYTVVETFTADITWYTSDRSATEYTLYDANDLYGLAAMMNTNGGFAYFAGKTIKLGADIDLKNTNWVPIGDCVGYYNKATGEYYPEHIFISVFDGQGHTISNLNVTSIVDTDDNKYDNDRGQYAALFGAAVDCTIKNLTIHNVKAYGERGTAAALVGYAYNVTIENIKVTGDVEIVAGEQAAGGIVAWFNDAVINNTTNVSTIKNITINANAGSKVQVQTATLKNYAGGVWGRGVPTAADNLTSNIDVYANDNYAGLIGGYKQSIATHATSTGTLYN